MSPILVDTCFARQPILDRRRIVCAYAVLYRGGPDSTSAGVVDGESATPQVLAGAFNDLDCLICSQETRLRRSSS